MAMLPQVLNKQKVIVTHDGNLRDKYERLPSPSYPNAYQELMELLRQVIAADERRGISTHLVFLDDQTLLQRSAVRALPGSEAYIKQTKQAIDTVFHLLLPHYCVLLGADDIVPFQQLRHPLYAFWRNHPRNIPSDLPYACTAGYSYKISDFLNPTRRVSRIPDVKGDAAKGIEVLRHTLGGIQAAAPRDKALYSTPWAACTQMRVPSIRGTLERMYGTPGAPSTVIPAQCPGQGANAVWPVTDYGRLTHLHILHGAPLVNRLYGEKDVATDPSQPRCPLAVRGESIDGNLTAGAVILEYACFGGQLYPPVSRPLPLVNMYLSSHAAAMVGSTVSTFSFGGPELPGPARVADAHPGELLLATFFRNLEGRCTGEAFLRARRWMIANCYMSHSALAMLAALTLYGDASLVPMADLPFDEATYIPGQTNVPALGVASYAAATDPLLPVSNDVREAITSHLQSMFGISSIEMICCNEVFEKGELRHGHFQYTAYVVEKIEGTTGADDKDNQGLARLSERFFLFETEHENGKSPVRFLQQYETN